ncbi:hypothetical protein N431DRAFT_434463 [Stipitochalara longipes BDJ]|nr:hypothetical protein N431DRAFT_434463 [Stipitochalara longipes BDJ]
MSRKPWTYLLRPRPLLQRTSSRHARPASSKRSQSQAAIPHLSAEVPGGTVKDIEEEDLYKYTRNRWIFNESIQLGQRYLKFNLRQLLKAAVAAVAHEGAQHCIKVLKCQEGLNNKAFILTMDNGSEVFAKLPNPVAGPACYTTASEVATRDFLRTALDIPIPQIIAYSADRNNSVGAEYILEAKAPGKPLGSLWYQWPIQARLEMIKQVVEIECKLASMTFTKSGCIYFASDIPTNLSHNLEVRTDVPIASSTLERFRLGPLVSSELWRGKRAAMDMNRGPYNTPLNYVKAMAVNEKLYIESHARSRMNYHRSSTEHPEEVLRLLGQCLQLAPAMIPPSVINDMDQLAPTLWHPDLHLDNIFVDPSTKKITQIIDWQSAAIMPFYYQGGAARMFQCPWTVADDNTVPALPDDYDTLDKSEQKRLESNRKTEICYKYYRAVTLQENPRNWAALLLKPQNLVRTEPSRLVTNVWSDHDTFFLRRALLSMTEEWEDLCPDAGKCPITFSDKDMELYKVEEVGLADSAEVLRIFKDNWGLQPDGMVDPDRWEEVKTEIEKLREEFVRLAREEGEDWERAGMIWPYHDTEREGW